jgi:hypothetical protein
MKAEELKLYNKYSRKEYDEEFIYIGMVEQDYYFLTKNNVGSNVIEYKHTIISLGFNYDLIEEKVKKLNYCIEDLYIGYDNIDSVERYFKPILKDKLNNILNR